MTWKQFIIEIASIKCIEEAMREAAQDWGADIPPTILFSIIGKKIAAVFLQLDNSDVALIFKKIEEGMTEENDVNFKAYLSTGLLQALYVNANKIDGNFDKIQKSMGVKSNSYLMEWVRFH